MQKEITKEYGEGVMINASFILGKEKIIIPTSPAIDIGLNGGIPQGSWVILSGPPKCGKSSLSLTIAANAQKLGMKVIYHNIEHRLKKKNLEGIHGLDINGIEVIESIKGKILTAEDHLDIAERFLNDQSNTVLILDSASALCSETERVDKISGQFRSIGPKLLASFCRRNESTVPVQDSIVIIIQHLIANTSGYGAKSVEDGGNKVKYQVDVKLSCSHTEQWKSGEDEIGKVVHWKVIESALGKPSKKIESYLRYGYGFDDEMEIAILAADIGLVTKNKAWWKYNDQNFNGKEAFSEHIRANPDVKKELYDQIRAAL